MKKAIYIILVLAMVGGVVGTLLYYLVPQGQKDPFADVPSPVVKSFKFSDLAGQDVSTVDFSGTSFPETFTFNTETKWPDKSKLPPGFSPETVMETGKYLGLGLRALHRSGITGAGVSVAVIDKPLCKSHESLKSNIEYIEMKPGDTSAADFHGQAASSILAGKDGVAPGAHLYYFAVPDDLEPYARYTEAMQQLLAKNKELPEGRKIRVVVVALAPDPAAAANNTGGAGDWSNIVQTAEASGVIVVYPGMPELDFTGAGCPPSKDRDDPANYEMWTWSSVKAQIAQKLRDAKAGDWTSARKELIRLLTDSPDLDSLQADAINTFIYMMETYKGTVEFNQWLSLVVGDSSNSLAVPADYITVASVDSDSSYTYYGAGGLSWSASYVAGLLALGLQVKPSATSSELFAALKDTGTAFAAGGKLVNPVGFIEKLR